MNHCELYQLVKETVNYCELLTSDPWIQSQAVRPTILHQTELNWTEYNGHVRCIWQIHYMYHLDSRTVSARGFYHFFEFAIACKENSYKNSSTCTDFLNKNELGLLGRRGLGYSFCSEWATNTDKRFPNFLFEPFRAGSKNVKVSLPPIFPLNPHAFVGDLLEECVYLCDVCAAG